MSKIILPPQNHRANLGQLHDFLAKTAKGAQLRGVAETTKSDEDSNRTSGEFERVIYLSSRSPEPAQKAAGKAVAAQRKEENKRAKGLVLNTLNGVLVTAEDSGLKRAVEEAIKCVKKMGKRGSSSSLKAGEVFNVIDTVVLAEKQANAAVGTRVTFAPSTPKASAKKQHLPEAASLLPRAAHPTDVRTPFVTAHAAMKEAEQKSTQSVFRLPVFEELEVKTRTDAGRAGMRTLANAFKNNTVPSDPGPLKGLYQEWQAMKTDGRLTTEILGENAGMAAIDSLLTAWAKMGLFSKSPPA